MKYREVVKMLKKNGWREVRSNGSHHAFKHPGSSYLAIVPEHGGKDISVGVLRELSKGTGLSFIR